MKHPLFIRPYTVFMLIASLSFSGCEEKEPILVLLPKIETVGASNITVQSASITGKIVFDGRNTILSSGICWSSTPKPTIKNEKIDLGNKEGSFTIDLKNLEYNTTYYVRTYASNSKGVAYGTEVSFHTIEHLAKVSTGQTSDISSSGLIISGNIESYSETVTDHGFCWSEKEHPTINDQKIALGSGTPTFQSTINNLKQGTQYYIRAYATNALGVSYGSVTSFTTLEDVLKDIDGNLYTSVIIGNQEWMVENLRVTHFSNGDPIPDLANLSETYVKNYGRLYSGNTVKDPRGIAPAGWHIPSQQEWKTLTTFLGANPAIKAKSKALWLTPGTESYNSSGFTALPGGYHVEGGTYDIGSIGFWWTSSAFTDPSSLWRIAMVDNVNIIGEDALSKVFHLSIRLIKD